MLEIDGAAGGGQVVRTALSLSALASEPVRLSGVRAERPSPGLRPQHLAALRLLADITDATVAGDEMGSETIEFDPGEVRPGRYEVDIGTAGSITLLFDAVLPLATALDGPLAIEARGGTDVRWSPPMDYLRHVKLALLRQYGLAAAIDVDRRGFYPTGEGAATLRLWPSSLEPIDLSASAAQAGARILSVATEDLTEADVAGRQAAAAEAALDALDVDICERRSASVAASSTGSAIVVRLDRGSTMAGGDALGERGTPAETVGERAVEPVSDVLESGAAVDRHLADQLLTFVGLAGGHVTFPAVTGHVETNASVLDQFGYPVSIVEEYPVIATAGSGGATT